MSLRSDSRRPLFSQRPYFTSAFLSGAAAFLLWQNSLAGAPWPDDPPAQFAKAEPTQIKRRNDKSEDELRRQLAWAPDVALRPQNMSALVERFALSMKINGGPNFEPTALLEVRPDLSTLPVRHGKACVISPNAAATLTVLSRQLRAYLGLVTPKERAERRPDPALVRAALQGEKRGARPEWLRVEVVPALLQILMHEDKPIRMMLVQLLAEIPERPATTALAQRAIFDLAPDVRAAAITALRDRPMNEFRPLLIRGLRYPWSPVADFAAEALVALQDRDAVPELVDLLDLPDPRGPFPVKGNRLVVREVVKISHGSNCLMCHPPAATSSDPVPGPVPDTLFVPPPSEPSSRYGGGGGSGGGSKRSSARTTAAPLWVRADVTYLRQDFSILQTAQPGLQKRFDYLVRRKSFSPLEYSQRRDQVTPLPIYEQRRAVLFALRELTGKDSGFSTASWLAHAPKPEPPAPPAETADAGKLANQLVRAPAQEQETLLLKLAESKGLVYTQAMARAIPRLTGSSKLDAREALVQRMTRMTRATLQDKLRDDDLETRRAAVLACPRKDEKGLVPHLIPLLQDRELPVARATRYALRSLTGKDFGPSDEDRPEAWANTLAAWRSWWQKNGGDELAELDEP
jgi:HEAT repeat protein